MGQQKVLQALQSSSAGMLVALLCSLVLGKEKMQLDQELPAARLHATAHVAPRAQ